MLTKEAQEQAYMIGVDMAIEEAGLDKTAGLDKIAAGPGKMQALMALLSKGGGRAKQIAAQSPVMAGAVGGAGIGGVGGAMFGDEGGFLRGVGGGALTGAGLGAGAGLAAKLHGAGKMGKGLRQIGQQNEAAVGVMGGRGLPSAMR